MSPVFPALDAAQGGDQFLDGIGETALAARYVLAATRRTRRGTTSTRTLRGSGAAFVDDARFGRALELTGNGSHVQLPGEALAGEDAVSVAGWTFVPTGGSGPFFDFGRSASSRLSAMVTAAGFRASVVSGETRAETPAAAVPVNQWVHLAVVLDPAQRVLTAYLDGARVGQATNVGVTAQQLFDQASGDANRLYIGRSQDAGRGDASKASCAMSASTASR